MIEKDEITIGGHPENAGGSIVKYGALFLVIEGLPIVRKEDVTEGWASLDVENQLASGRIKTAIYKRYHRNRDDINYTVQLSDRKSEIGVTLWFRRIYKNTE